MPVSAQTPLNIYSGNGSVTTFPYTFLIIAQNDLHVYVNSSEVSSGFLITGVGNNAGGSVEFSTAPAAGSTIRIQRIVAIDRTSDYQEGGAITSSTLDNDFDRVVMMVQDLTASTVKTLGGGLLDAQSQRIVNVVDPSNNQDAATKNYVDTASSSQAAQAAASAAAALSSKNAASTSETNAATSASAALISKNAANVSESNAQGHANNAAASESNALSYSTSAASSLSTFNGKYVASATTPPAPTAGMLWYNTTTHVLQVYGTSAWESVNYVDFNVQFSLPFGVTSTYTMLEYSSINFTVVGAVFKTDTGTISANVKIGSTSITGLSALSLTTTQSTATATALNGVVIGNKVSISFSNPSSASNVSVVLRCIKA